jgi:hypothetical protein
VNEAHSLESPPLTPVPAQLDRSNVANAYVSGMKEDLGFQGNQLNQINTCFTVG